MTKTDITQCFVRHKGILICAFKIWLLGYNISKNSLKKKWAFNIVNGWWTFPHSVTGNASGAYSQLRMSLLGKQRHWASASFTWDAESLAIITVGGEERHRCPRGSLPGLVVFAWEFVQQGHGHAECWCRNLKNKVTTLESVLLCSWETSILIA